MEAAIQQFFGAWAEADSPARLAAIAAALGDSATYSDPRSDGRISGLEAVADYIGHFSANAPGWSATVDAIDEVNGYAKVVVSFGGPGPDGEHMAQQGTYFVEADSAGKLIALAGFVWA